MKTHKIKNVIENEIAHMMEVEPGDEIISINGSELKDIFDYRYLIQDTELSIVVKKHNGEEWVLEIEKEESDDLGIEFEEELMDSYRSCTNGCIFCFIDQMPPNMRKTLYFKDDDSRLSFLQGNYISLTNMKQEDINQVIRYKLSPINISVHTMNKQLRCKMLKNRFAGDALGKIDQFFNAGIEMNGQIVCCKGYNDGEEFKSTVLSLEKYIPHMRSVSVVPVGLTKFRQNLEQLEKFNKEDSISMLKIVDELQEYFLNKYNTRFIYASDEWYLTAARSIPNSGCYEGFGQIENGVGMIRSFLDEFYEGLEQLSGDNRSHSVSIATGVLAAPIIEQTTEKIVELFPNIKMKVYTIINNFFGTDITVAGLLTGTDIINQLKDKELGDYLILPSVLLKHGENILLDDITLYDIEIALQKKIHIVQSDGQSLIDGIIEGETYE